MLTDAGLDDARRGTDAWDAAGGDAAGADAAGADATGGGATGRGDAGEGDGGEQRPRPGADSPDPRKLAQDWITLWQSELSAMAADPELRESWQTIMALWAGSASALLRGLPRETRGDGARGGSGTADAARASAAAAAPDARDAEIDRLARHVAALERRLAELARFVDIGRSVGGADGGGGAGDPKRDAGAGAKRGASAGAKRGAKPGGGGKPGR